MKESIDQLSDYLSAIYKHRWPMLLTTALVCLLGWTGVFLLPDKFQATSKLLMSNESMMGPLLKGLAAESNLTREMASLMRRTLLSRPNLEKVIDVTDLNLLVSTRMEREGLIRDLGDEVTVTGNEDSKVYSVSYIGEDPKLVTDIVQTLTDLFIELSIGATRKDTSITREFLDREVSDYERKLRNAEERLKIFKRENIGLMPSEGETYFSQLQEKLELLELTKLTLAEANKRMSSIVLELTKVPKIIPRKTLQISDNSLNEEITILQSQLEDLRSKYTNAYPGIIAAEQRLNSLMQQRLARDSATTGVQGTSPEAAVSIIESRQNLNLELSRERGEVGALRVRVNGLSNQVARMRKNVDIMPRVEAQLAQLDRDYGVIKQTYEGLVQRREATALSHQADTSSSDFQFQVIESPVVPTLPVSPDRFKLVIAVFIMGLGAGIMLAIILSQMKEYIPSISKLKEIVNFPVYGSITEIISRKDRAHSRRRMALLSAFWSMLLMVFVGLMYITLNNISLASLLAKQGGLV